MSPVGELCSDVGLTAVDNPVECQCATLELGYVFGGVESSDVAPTGCYGHYNNYNKIFWNSHSTEETRIYENTELCRTNG